MKRKTDSSGSSCPDEGQQIEPRVGSVETTVSQGLRVTADESSYDAACKRLLSEKAILARIMKACLDEYKDCNVNDIAEKYIEGQPLVDKLPVAPDEEAAPLITGMDTEEKSKQEGSFNYDIRFRAIAPSSNEQIALIINVEAQNNFYPGYPLIKRGIYYCSRMISSQYGREFTGSHYEKIKKVYSIWICMKPPQYRQNTITRYRLIEEHLVGKSKELLKNYDLLSVIMLCLGGAGSENYDGVIRMLDVLLSDDTSVSEKQKILLDDYDIQMTKTMEGEVSAMCNLSQGIKEKGVAEGIAKGRAEGVVEGTIRTLKQLGVSKADAVKHIINNGMPAAEAEGQVSALWDAI